MPTTELKPAARVFEIDVSNERFEHRALRFVDRLITGREMIEQLGYHPADDFIVLHYRPDGALEDVGLETKIDLTEPDKAYFVNRASEMANLVIEGVRLTWTEAKVTGLVLKLLARKDPDAADIYLEHDDAAPELIEDDREIRLDRAGLERFILKPARDVLIEVNNKPVTIRRGCQTGASIKAAAIHDHIDIQMSFTLSEDKPGGSIIGDTDPVHIKGGEKFLAIDDHDDS